jgi:hypothetical protein
VTATQAAAPEAAWCPPIMVCVLLRPVCSP